MYLQPVRKKRRPADDPSLGLRLGVIAIVGLLLLGVLGFRLWFLQVLSGDQYLVMANNNRVREVDVEAPRGVIFDRNGRELVQNRAGLSVGILPMDLRNEDEVVPRLAEILEIAPEDIYSKLDQAEDNPYVITTIKEDVPETPTVAYLEEHSLEFPGVQIRKSHLRRYPREDTAAHVLGYVGEISKDELEKEQFRSLQQGARVGKTGVEETYDSFLRGESGVRRVEVDAAGRPKRLVEVVDPLPGKNLILTLDATLQEAAEKAISEGIERAREDGFEDAAAGSVVALNPQNGEVLAMASYPDYDPSLWVGGMSSEDYERLTAEGSHNRLFNRALKGRYPAASTFKPFVASVALWNDLYSWDDRVFCGGSFQVSGQVWKDWLPEGHGEVNMVEALMESCDVYFYNIGQDFYEQTGPVFQDGLREFGFGQATGIDVPGEYVGRVPDAEWKRETGETDIDRLWKTGDDVNLAIGQGDLLVTPLQLGTAFAVIANGGDLLVPRLGNKITDASGNVIHEFEPEVRREISMNQEDLDAVRRGLKYVTSEPTGTGYATFRDFPITVGGKTGTAEKKPEDDYAWFMGYAPAEDPEILVVALIEQGGHGSSVAAPAVRRVLEAYFQTETTTPEDIQVTE